ncbi:5-oxopent-3-ene-1,2,5-tricarboxylate decarboxylase/2-hydroxyhepta-2,4-diene-1,7-dioate isomerase [Kribbella amoyensis]|uniref:5-oxopent-3-ene-1,2,5-tricarboxylate decarboxylase/2-hydroxyhepta-2,4-diene-1,7-dioate isomerase n=1 Tax=Kribbella amoyensis TaxID=996641 RepID=A0A561B967_9ACTN|nr:fumarylacetoacetate hydrolase family protein [Kribbella amoyensis]TWD75339.1 5-oxopent-3-ene-1,2,5-tricarboxylate decarboxylase/2-hydroxyhepta-2,4-diene-1,7-dioate isomerase [Kribbella amoyensis]
MQFARVRRAPGHEVELVSRQSDGKLVPLSALDRSGLADPVALIARFPGDELARAVEELGAAELLDAEQVLFEPPVATCTKVCCLALNYRDHAEESNLEVPVEPVLFFKPPSALTGHRTTVVAPRRTRHLEHEVELAVVIGRPTRDLPAERWAEAVAGYTVINDMTARDLQLVNIERNVPWDQSKGFDTFAPLGPYLVTPDEIPDPGALQMRLEVGGAVRQQANTAQMVYGIPELIANLSDGMTLLPGDVIATGTTAGLAPLAEGDVMRATIDGLGTLENDVHFG